MNSPLKITQGCYSYLSELTADQIKGQIGYVLSFGFAVSIEYTTEPHPRHSYWDMWGLPMFARESVDDVWVELARCMEAKPGCFIKVCVFDSARGVESCVMSFIVQRPIVEPVLSLHRQEVAGRKIRYSVELQKFSW